MDEAASCFGFQIDSAASLTYLRRGNGEPLHIAESAGQPEGRAGDLLYEWLPRPGHPFHGRLHEDGNLYHFWVAGMGSFIVNPGGHRIGLPQGSDPIQREERLWGIPAALCVLHRGDLPLHAAAVDAGEGAILLGAPGRFGKSTLAAAFHVARHRVLSEDMSCVRLADAVAVIPGPAMLRVRKDVMAGLPLRDARVVGGDDERVSLAVNEARRGTCHPVPLRAVVLLRESTGDITLERVPWAAAIPDLWTLAFRLPTAQGRARCFAAIVNLAKAVPTWNLYRPLRLDGLMETVNRVTRTCLGA